MILAIDQGTTGTTCIVFDDQGRPRGRSYSEFEQHFPKPGWVEHDAAEIWEVTRKVAIGALADAAVQGSDLKGIGITNQRETVVAWDPKTGEPAHRALVWQDRRTAARCEELREQGHESLIRDRTGLVIDPYFSGTKIEWLIQHGDLGEGVVFGTIDSWLVFKLTGRHLIDYSNASRTMLFDIRRLRWDEELCGLLGVDPGSLPEPVPSSDLHGTTAVFGGEVPVAGIAGDQQAALFGQACQRAGETKATYGTGSFVLLNTGTDAPEPGEGLLTTVAWGLGGEVDYALEAAVFVTGAAVQWLRDGLGIISEAAETESLAASLDSNDDVYFVPALTGLGSPHWDPYARGTIVGLTRGSGRAHLARAALEAIAYQTVDAVRAQESAAGESVRSLKADGGAVVNSWLMQFQADVLGVPVIVPEVAETTALGAAYLAGIATGLWSVEQVREMWREAATFEPGMPAFERDELVGRWRQAVTRARGWARRA
ncbi:MAG: glycerol kinase GlpK [Solirubrobacterales bacterium]